MKLCMCGCGRVITPSPKHKYREPKYVVGHRARGTATHVYTPKPEEIPLGLCECGCGKQTTIAKTTYRTRRIFRGYPTPYLTGHSPYRLKKGAERGNWKGGRMYHGGYVMAYRPDDPRTDQKGYIPEHRIVWEEANGRSLRPNEQVHHINGIRDDNRPENLVALTLAEHRAEHRAQQSALIKRQVKEDPTFASRAGKKGAAARWKGHVKKSR